MFPTIYVKTYRNYAKPQNKEIFSEQNFYTDSNKAKRYQRT